MTRAASNQFRAGLVPICALMVAFLVLQPSFSSLHAQAPVDGRRAMATRAELEASVAEAQQIVNSRAYSDELRSQKQQELALIEDRLKFGDFRVGDQMQIITSVPTGPNQPPLNGLYTIGVGQMLELPGLPAISMAGVLRSEAEAHLSEQFARYFKVQTVQVTPLVRLSLMGGVSNAGFYQVPADLPLPDVIMLAGGPVSNVDYERSEIRRGEEVIWEGEEVALAIQQAATPDQLNLRAGDEFEVGVDPPRNWLQTLRTFAIIPGLILSFYGLGRLAGIF